MSLFSESRAVTLAQAADGVVSITKQEAGLIPGLLAEATGRLNGGMSTSVGLSHTLAAILDVAGGAALANRTRLTDNLPLIGKY